MNSVFTSERTPLFNHSKVCCSHTLAPRLSSAIDIKRRGRRMSDGGDKQILRDGYAAGGESPPARAEAGRGLLMGAQQSHFLCRGEERVQGRVRRQEGAQGGRESAPGGGTAGLQARRRYGVH